MNLILDASAGIEVAAKQPKSKSISALLDGAIWVIAPDLYIAEAANAYWKMHHFSKSDLAICEEALDTTISLVDEFFATKDLCKESFSLACSSNHPAYDIFYCVLARRHNAQLVTLDKKLKAIALKNGIKVASI